MSRFPSEADQNDRIDGACKEIFAIEARMIYAARETSGDTRIELNTPVVVHSYSVREPS